MAITSTNNMWQQAPHFVLSGFGYGSNLSVDAAKRCVDPRNVEANQTGRQTISLSPITGAPLS